MKVLVVGGNYDLSGGKTSGLVNKIYGAINEEKKIYNGANYLELEKIIQEVKDYDVVFWMANVDNSLLKIRDVKEIAPHVMLVNSKRNDGNKYSFKELTQRAIAQKANLSFEFRKENDLFKIRVFDPLGSVWYEGFNIKEAVEKTMNRLSFLMSITRQATFKSEDNKNLIMNWYFDRFKQEEYKSEKALKVDIKDEYLALIHEYSKRFHEIMGEENVDKVKSMLNAQALPPQVFRCAKGMPSFRVGEYVVVSKRNITHQMLEKEDFIVTYIENDKLFYCGDEKPAVDTPVQIKLYKNLPNINYIIHSHNYIENAPFTTKAIPCGAIEEAEEVLKTIMKEYGSLNKNAYSVNLVGHGAFLMGHSIEDMKGFKYIGRPMPEKMF